MVPAVGGDVFMGMRHRSRTTAKQLAGGVEEDDPSATGAERASFQNKGDEDDQSKYYEGDTDDPTCCRIEPFGNRRTECDRPDTEQDDDRGVPQYVQGSDEQPPPLRLLCRCDIGDRDDVIPVDPVSQAKEECSDKEPNGDASGSVHGGNTTDESPPLVTVIELPQDLPWKLPQ